MSENNKSYRIRTKIGVNEDSPVEDKYLTVKLTEKFDSIDIMSLKIKQENAYKFHAADYGVVVGRAIANGGFGVPNVKVSVFIAATDATKNDAIYNAIYPYTKPTQKNTDNIRYNLLPDVGNDDCYQVVGTFPNKRLVLDDDNYMEIYDNYYKFTTRTNNAGDYMIFGIPTGGQILHFDTDLSDVGVLSQKPRDMIFKGYNINQFENANQFKVDDNLANLPQIISQDDSVYVYPFWGDEDENVIGITRHDIDINYKFEPTCVFMGSIVSDTNSNHISKKCIPTAEMGMMEELITGSGTIEMIRKKQNGEVEQFNIQGTQLINDNGVWCYQIPMNLDYLMTDEYGNLVPSNDPTKGIATRTSVRFRFSMQDFENDSLNSFRTKVLVPNNPQNARYEPDYVFGSFTEDESFRDLLWNNVYTVKSFIPRFQKGNGNRNRRFSGIKQCNYHGQNNPIPYNNMRINLSFQFVITCLIVRALIWLVGVYNGFITALSNVLSKVVNNGLFRTARTISDWFKTVGGNGFWGKVLRVVINTVLSPISLLARGIAAIGDFFNKMAKSLSCIYIDGSMCEALEGSWFFAPNCSSRKVYNNDPNFYIWKNMMARIDGRKMDQVDYSSSKTKTGGGMEDKQSIDSNNADDKKDAENQVVIYDSATATTSSTSYQYVISRGLNYFLQCVEISLAQEFRVIQFDFYNDWINGMVYIPRWERSLKKKRKYFLFGKSRVEIRACNDTYKKRFFERKNNLTEQCGVSYKAKVSDNSIGTKIGCKDNKKYKCHKKPGRKQFRVFNDGGVVHSELTASGLYAYYFRPCEYVTYRNMAKNRKVNLFATDIVLLGSLVDCDINGTPVFTNELTSTTYQIPAPLAHTDSTEEGFTYKAVRGDAPFGTGDTFSGIFDVTDAILNPQDDGTLTEESGIDWGYTGPGQGEVKKAKLYTPGGHFLGISCVSAESSIKSCVNLKRICEVNVWPSSRQEVFDGYGDDNTGKYLDIIPNGVIAKDDISGGNFRKIFSTLNQNNLKTKVNENGLTVYDFEYMSPENFGGELYRYTRGNYNEANPLSEEALDKYLIRESSDDSLVDEDGVSLKDVRTQYLDEKDIKPIRRSLDDRDSDYMRFRLGLEKDNNSTIQTKYLGNDENGYYMPVYNNSFYFYFGLVPGSTALDELRRQFFAECKHTMSTRDMRLNATLSYVGCGDAESSGILDAFSTQVEVSIFHTGVTSTDEDELRVFSTALPIKIVVDSKYSKIYKDEVSSKQVYVGIKGWEEDGKNVFDFGLGKHVIQITDSEGRSATKLVEVVQQKLTVCTEITGIPFKEDDYIINSTEKLVNGTAPNRDNLEGWFNFEYANTENCSGGTIFTYKDINPCVDPSVPGDYETKHLKKSDIGDKLTMLFVSKSHIVKVGDFSTSDILEFEEFASYSEDTVFDGVTVNTRNGFYVYAGEEGNYDLYVIVKDGTESTIPILIQDNIYIGEPDAIDFNIFRDVIESEDDAPITFRNPLIKIWHKYPNNWYEHIDDPGSELSDDQKWYIRKNLFYVLRGPLDKDSELNDTFTSMRVASDQTQMRINLFYPSTVGDVNTYVNGDIKQQFDVKDSGEVLGDFDMGILMLRGFPIDIYITGRTEDNSTLRTPPLKYGGGIFKHPVLYKPYYYKSVIWEGYGVLNSGRGSYGEVHGNIYNGIPYYYDSIRATAFGPTVLNERITIDNAYIALANVNDMIVNRNGLNVTTINYPGDNATTFSDSVNSLLITEGSPKYYESVYTPVEYSIESSSIGNEGNWNLDFEMVITSTTPTAKFILSFENNEYSQVNWYFNYDKPLSATTNIEDAVETIDPEELATKYRDGIGMVGTITGGVGDIWSGDIPLRSPNGVSGAAEPIRSGTLLVENLKRDSIVFSSGVTSSDKEKGYLISRNFVRNGIAMDYSYEKAKIKEAVQVVITLSDYFLNNSGKKWVSSFWHPGRYNNPSIEESKRCGILRVVIPVIIGHENNAEESEDCVNFRKNIGLNYDEIIVEFDGTPYELVNGYGYTFDYLDGNLIVELSDPYPMNDMAVDQDGVYHDSFTDTLTDIWIREKTSWKDWKDRYRKVIDCRVTLTSSGIENKDNNKYDAISTVKLVYDGKIVYKQANERLSDESGEDD